MIHHSSRIKGKSFDSNNARIEALEMDGLVHRLRNLFLNGAYPTIMSSPPTVTYGTAAAASTINGNVAKTYTYGSTDLRFTYLGAATAPGPSGSLQQMFQVPVTVDAKTYYTGGIMEVIFDTDAPKFDFGTVGIAGGQFRLWVDGQLCQDALYDQPGTGGSSYFVLVDFSGVRKRRRIKIQFCGAGRFGGVNITPIDTVWKVNIDTPRLMIAGDSYTTSTGADNSCKGYARTLGHLLGIEDTWLCGSGGTGYLADNNGNGKTLGSRMQRDIIGNNPDILVIAMGINDALKDPDVLQTEINNVHRTLLMSLPQTLIFTLAPWRAPGSNPPQSICDAVKNGVISQPEYGKRLFLIDTFTENWQFGTGYAGNLKNDGNSDVYITSDHTHPNQLGHDYLAYRCAESIKKIINSIAA